MENGAKVKEQNPDFKVGDVAKANGVAWAKLTDEDKKPFVEMSKKDAERFEKETKQLKELGYFINKDGIKSTMLNKKGKEMEFPPNTYMPKKKTTPYMAFLKEYHEVNKEACQGVAVGITAKKISEAWAAITDAKKKKFEDLAAKDGERYDDQINQLKKNGFFMTEDGTKSSDLTPKAPKVKRAKKAE